MIIVEKEQRRNAMNDEYLVGLLNRVGKSTFIKYYTQLKKVNSGVLESPDIVMMMDESFTDKSKNSRVTKGKRIFREGLEVEALELIVSSSRMASNVIVKAQEILQVER
jgi:hypothetical protein